MYNLHTFVVLKNTCSNIPQLSHSTYFSLFLKFSIYGPYSLLLIFSFLWGGGGKNYIWFRGFAWVLLQVKCFAFKLISPFTPPCNHKSKVATHPRANGKLLWTP